MQRIKLLVAGLWLAASFWVIQAPQLAYAQSSACSNSSSFLLGLPTWYKYLKVGPVVQDGKTVDECGIELPKNADGGTDITQTAGRIGLAAIEIMLRIGAMVSIGFIIYGGFRYILSQGEPDNIKKAQGTVLGSVIGLVITIFATAIVSFIGNVLIR